MDSNIGNSLSTWEGELGLPIYRMHQVTLTPYLFTTALDVLTEHIQELVPRCMLCANNIVLLGESREVINGKLELWRQTFKEHV